MATFVIADLHLPFGDESKTMEVFGGRWTNYTDKLKQNWLSSVTENDTVILAGDTSWGMEFETALPDLEFINTLPGKKILLEGNHDFWWNTVKKMTSFFEENGLSFSILRNNAYDLGDFILCGSRGWYTDKKNIAESTADNFKIVNRENMRLRASLEAGKKLSEEKPVIAVLHFPPVYGSYLCEEITNTLSEYGVKLCFYGHIHGVHGDMSDTVHNGIRYKMISADHLNFKPYKIIY